MQVQGTINAIFSTETVGENFTKRVFWLTTEEDTKYPQTIQLEFTKDKCSDLDRYKSGDKVEVEFNLRGRQWAGKDGNAKVFNTLQVWKIKKTDGGESAPVTNGTRDMANTVADSDDSDLPF